MSKNMKGVLGEQFGKVGPVVARKFRTENVYSAYQKNVSNPRTEAQQIQRMKFKALSELAHNFACGAIFGFRAAAKGTNKSPRNLFQKTNWPMIEANTLDSMRIDYTGMSVSKGGLDNVAFGTPSFDTPGSVKVTFVNSFVACQQTTNDKVYVYIYCPDAKTGVLSEGVKRNEATITVQVPAYWMGLRVHVYGFCRNEGQAVEEFGIAAGEASPTQYCGSGDIG